MMCKFWAFDSIDPARGVVRRSDQTLVAPWPTTVEERLEYNVSPETLARKDRTMSSQSPTVSDALRELLSEVSADQLMEYNENIAQWVRLSGSDGSASRSTTSHRLLRAGASRTSATARSVLLASGTSVVADRRGRFTPLYHPLLFDHHQRWGS